MKTTIELPDDLLIRAKVAAARDQRTLKQLVIEGLEHVLEREHEAMRIEEALDRIDRGYHLGGRPMTRERSHER